MHANGPNKIYYIRDYVDEVVKFFRCIDWFEFSWTIEKYNHFSIDWHSLF